MNDPGFRCERKRESQFVWFVARNFLQEAERVGLERG
jgi:hypothetical protein